jgi:hypothetical protein
MAGNRDTRLNVDLTATDNASNKIDRVADKADALERDPVEVEVDADTSGFGSAIDGLSDKLGGLGGQAEGLASKFATPAGAAAAIGAGLLMAADHAADVAIAADNLASLTGDSVENASRLNAVFAQAGVEGSDLQDIMLQMGGVLADNADLAAQLGINMNDGATVGERFKQVVSAVGTQFDDAGERSLVMARLFGEEGVRQVNTVIGAVGDLDSALAAVPEGNVISEEEVERAREYKQNMAELKAEFAAFAASIGQVVLPALTGLADGFNGLFEGAEGVGQSIRGWFDGGAAQANRDAVQAFEDGRAAAAAFDMTLLDGLETFDQVREKVIAWAEANGHVEQSLDIANVVALQWNETQQAATAITEQATEAVEELATEEEILADRLGTAYEKLNAVVEAQESVTNARRAAADTTFALHDAERQFADQVASTTEDLTTQDLSLLEVRASLESTASAAADVADKERQLAEETATANGYTLSAKEAQRAWNESMIESASALDGPMRQAVLNYIAQVNGIPPEKLTEILPFLDDGTLTEVEAQLAALARDRLAVVRVRLAGGRVTNDGGIDFGGGVIAGAEGGIVNRPTLALIGEAGREAVVPLNRSPGNSPLPQGFGGGVPLAVHVYDRGGVEHIVQAKIDQHDAELLAALRAG